MKTLVIIPCYNEAENISRVIEELSKELPDAEILIVNDNSTDQSTEIIKKLSVKYLDLPFNLGYSGALQAGFKYAVKNHYDYVIQFDGDGQHIPSEAKKLLDSMLINHYDIVIGSRFKENMEYDHGFLKKIGTSIFHLLIKLICKKDIYDPTSGFQVLNKKVFTHYSKMNNFPEFPDANLIIEMLLNGYTIEEIPTKMRLRAFGTSMHSGFWKPIIYMINMFYSIIMILLNYIFIKRKQHD